jgi:hypothetical protein
MGVAFFVSIISLFVWLMGVTCFVSIISLFVWLVADVGLF